MANYTLRMMLSDLEGMIDECIREEDDVSGSNESDIVKAQALLKKVVAEVDQLESDVNDLEAVEDAMAKARKTLKEKLK